MNDLGLLAFRLCFAGTLFINHGLNKLLNFRQMVEKFPDPLHIGSMNSLSLTIFAEVGCAFLCLIGLFTRISAAPIVICMAVAVFIIHGDDPFDKKELALMYLGAFFTLMLIGPGSLSVDRK